MTLDILYYTDNSLDPEIAEFCRRELVRAADGKMVILVSQKPIEHHSGPNICVGNIGRSYLSMYKQVLAGLQAARSDVIAMAEHDCCYSPQHFNWKPPKKDVFYYNLNNWLVNWKQGHYTRTHNRTPMSQLICGRDAAIENVQERIWALEHGYSFRHNSKGYCSELGIQPITYAFVPECTSRTFKQWEWSTFSTELPNLDIRHDHNFSGRKSSGVDAWELPYWGRFERLKNAA